MPLRKSSIVVLRMPRKRSEESEDPTWRPHKPIRPVTRSMAKKDAEAARYINACTRMECSCRHVVILTDCFIGIRIPWSGQVQKHAQQRLRKAQHAARQRARRSSETEQQRAKRLAADRAVKKAKYAARSAQQRANIRFMTRVYDPPPWRMKRWPNHRSFGVLDVRK